MISDTLADAAHQITADLRALPRAYANCSRDLYALGEILTATRRWLDCPGSQGRCVDPDRLRQWAEWLANPDLPEPK